MSCRSASAACDTSLELAICAESQTDLEKTARVISSHLERFAFRENPEVEWSLQPGPEKAA